MKEDSKRNDEGEADIRQSPSASTIHSTIVQEAKDELSRPTAALFWSGLAAGMSMCFSLIAEGMLKAYLPKEDWSVLVTSFGYSIGFLIIILGRQQLFTENTLTPVLPLFHRRDMPTLLNVLRLWGVVLIANLLGTFLVSLVIAQPLVFHEKVRQAFSEIGKSALEPDFGTTLVRGIFAGWLIALMVWLLPYAKTARIWVIIIITYVIGLGHLSHVIAGSAEVFTLAAMGEVGWGVVFSSYILPALIGNVLGGVVLVAALNHAQANASSGS